MAWRHSSGQANAFWTSTPADHQSILNQRLAVKDQAFVDGTSFKTPAPTTYGDAATDDLATPRHCWAAVCACCEFTLFVLMASAGLLPLTVPTNHHHQVLLFSCNSGTPRHGGLRRPRITNRAPFSLAPLTRAAAPGHGVLSPNYPPAVALHRLLDCGFDLVTRLSRIALCHAACRCCVRHRTLPTTNLRLDGFCGLCHSPSGTFSASRLQRPLPGSP